jgi:hypothetical protein
MPQLRPVHPASEIPPPPAVPSGITVAGPGGWRVLIPSAVLVAVVTALASAGAVRCSAPFSSVPEDTRRDISEIRSEVRELANEQRKLLDRIEKETQSATNARALDELHRVSLRERLEKVERSRL